MKSSPGEYDRREFAARLAVGAVAAPWAVAATMAAEAAAPTDKPNDKPNDKPADKPTDKPATETPDEKPAFNPVAMQLEYLVRQYPSDELTVEGLRLIAGKLASQLAHGRLLGEFPLDNSDGPGFVFSAYRGS